MCKGIYESREKDYTNPFRKMVYDTKKEMNKVLGKLEDNTFIQQQLGAWMYLKRSKGNDKKYKTIILITAFIKLLWLIALLSGTLIFTFHLQKLIYLKL